MLRSTRKFLLLSSLLVLAHDSFSYNSKEEHQQNPPSPNQHLHNDYDLEYQSYEQAAAQGHAEA